MALCINGGLVVPWLVSQGLSSWRAGVFKTVALRYSPRSFLDTVR